MAGLSANAQHSLGSETLRLSVRELGRPRLYLNGWPASPCARPCTGVKYPVAMVFFSQVEDLQRQLARAKGERTAESDERFGKATATIKELHAQVPVCLELVLSSCWFIHSACHVWQHTTACMYNDALGFYDLVQVAEAIDGLLTKQAVALKNDEHNAVRKFKNRLTEVSAPACSVFNALPHVLRMRCCQAGQCKAGQDRAQTPVLALYCPTQMEAEMMNARGISGRKDSEWMERTQALRKVITHAGIVYLPCHQACKCGSSCSRSTREALLPLQPELSSL